MPTLVQSQAFLIPIIPYDEGTDLVSWRKIESAAFEADTSILVHQYLINIVTCLFLTVSHLDERFKQASRPTALCLGIGGGVSLNFLNTELGFNVTGVDPDETAATEHFEFNKSHTIRLYVKDAIEAIQIFQNQKPEENKDDDSDVHKEIETEKFDMFMADLDSSEVKNGFSSSPTKFVKKPVFSKQYPRFLKPGYTIGLQ